MSLRSSDKDLLETFRICLHLKNRIAQTYNNGYAVRPSYRIQFGNVQFYDWLLRIGLFPAKTYTIGKIQIPGEYFRDFLRGHLDGDGSILTYSDDYNVYKGKRYLNTRIYTNFISASKRHILWLARMIRSRASVQGNIERSNAKENRVPIWKIRFAKYESLTLLRWIYYRNRLPSLKRKRRLSEALLKRVRNDRLVR